MRNVYDIVNNPCLRMAELMADGGHGEIHIGGWDGSIIWTRGAGWEHVSVSPYAKRITPSWDDMCHIKDIFWKDDEVAIQIHPQKDKYVNNMPNCLHLWSCTYKPMILPPSCLVGIREGQTREELTREIREAYEEAGEKFDG